VRVFVSSFYLLQEADIHAFAGIGCTTMQSSHTHLSKFKASGCPIECTLAFPQLPPKDVPINVASIETDNQCGRPKRPFHPYSSRESARAPIWWHLV
jgi:hypothetical protein